MECEAAVTKINENRITLDQTVFFAFAGGQASDLGGIGGIPVTEAVVQGEDIVYTLEADPPFKSGDTVKVTIDRERRERLMKLHSATHIVYCLFNDKKGSPKLIGSNVSPDRGRLDYQHPENIKPMIPGLEEEVNRFLAENKPIETKPDREKPDKWWWSCEAWNVPCGGTHVVSTGEIGRVSLKRRNIGAGKERIEITLG